MKEADIIDALKLSIDQSHPDVVLPIGDDGSIINLENNQQLVTCLLYTSPSPRDATLSRMPSSA